MLAPDGARQNQTDPDRSRQIQTDPVVVFWRRVPAVAHSQGMHTTTTSQPLPIPEFQQIVEQLCRSATDEFTAARVRLERLRREGPDTTEQHGSDRS